jgi:hypothetical protein
MLAGGIGEHGTVGGALMGIMQSGALGEGIRSGVVAKGTLAPGQEVILGKQHTRTGQAARVAQGGFRHILGQMGIGGGPQLDLDNKQMTTSQSNLRSAVKEANRQRRAVVMAEDMIKDGKTPKDDPRFLAALDEGKLTADTTFPEMVKTVTGKDISKATDKEIRSVFISAQSSGYKEITDDHRENLGVASDVVNKAQIAELKKAKDQLSSIREEMEDVVQDEFGLDITLEPQVADKLMAARHLEDQAMLAPSKAKAVDLKNRATKQRQEAKQMQQRLTGEALGAEGQTAFDTISGRIKGATQFSELSKEGLQHIRKIEDIQVSRGALSVAEAIDNDLIKAKDLSSDKVKQIRGITGRLMGDDALSELMDLDDEEQRLLKKTGAGRAVVGALTTFEKMAAVPTSDEAEFRNLTRKVIGDKDDINRVVNKFNDEGAKAATDLAMRLRMSMTAGDQAATSAGAGLEGAAGTSLEAYATQTSINMQTYQVLSALAAKLGVGQTGRSRPGVQ